MCSWWGGKGDQTDYWFLYVKGERPDDDDMCLFLPGGWELLEFEIKATPHGAYSDQWVPSDEEEENGIRVDLQH